MSPSRPSPSPTPTPSTDQTTAWPIVMLVGGFLSFVGIMFTPLAGILAIVVVVLSGLLLRFALLPRDRTRLKIALGISGTATLLFILMLLLTIG